MRGWHSFERSVKRPSCSAGRCMPTLRCRTTTTWPSKRWRKALAREYAQTKLAPEWAADELEEFRQNRWQQELEVGLAQIGQTLDDAAVAPKTISWKLELAYRLRQASAPPYSWIAKTLRMGAASSVRAALSRRLQLPAG